MSSTIPLRQALHGATAFRTLGTREMLDTVSASQAHPLFNQTKNEAATHPFPHEEPEGSQASEHER